MTPGHWKRLVQEMPPSPPLSFQNQLDKCLSDWFSHSLILPGSPRKALADLSKSFALQYLISATQTQHSVYLMVSNALYEFQMLIKEIITSNRERVHQPTHIYLEFVQALIFIPEHLSRV